MSLLATRAARRGGLGVAHSARIKSPLVQRWRPPSPASFAAARIDRLAGPPSSLKARVVGPRIGALLGAVVERLDARDRLDFTQRVEALLAMLEEAGLAGAISAAQWLGWVTRALLRDGAGAPPPASRDYDGYRRLRDVEPRVAGAYALAELAARVPRTRERDGLLLWPCASRSRCAASDGWARCLSRIGRASSTSRAGGSCASGAVRIRRAPRGAGALALYDVISRGRAARFALGRMSASLPGAATPLGWPRGLGARRARHIVATIFSACGRRAGASRGPAGAPRAPNGRSASTTWGGARAHRPAPETCARLQPHGANGAAPLRWRPCSRAALQLAEAMDREPLPGLDSGPDASRKELEAALDELHDNVVAGERACVVEGGLAVASSSWLRRLYEVVTRVARVAQAPRGSAAVAIDPIMLVPPLVVTPPAADPAGAAADDARPIEEPVDKGAARRGPAVAAIDHPHRRGARGEGVLMPSPLLEPTEEMPTARASRSLRGVRSAVAGSTRTSANDRLQGGIDPAVSPATRRHAPCPPRSEKPACALVARTPTPVAR